MMVRFSRTRPRKGMSLITGRLILFRDTSRLSTSLPRRPNTRYKRNVVMAPTNRFSAVPTTMSAALYFTCSTATTAPTTAPERTPASTDSSTLEVK